MSTRRLVLTLFAAGLIGAPTASPATATRANGEPSRTPAKAALGWKLAGYPVARTATIRYRDLEPRRILDVQKRNARRVMKPTQVGIARSATADAATVVQPVLRWSATGRGGSVARMTVQSPDALALRVGLQIDRLDERIELRFAGSDDPRRVVAVLRGDEILRLRGPDGVFWTPSTDGDLQMIEIHRPAGVGVGALRFHAPQVSHLLANSRNDFKIIEKVGQSGSCNVDTACRVAELGTHFVNAKNAVANMQFVVSGSTYICTGTLLADTTPGTQVPYFYGANHCFSDGAPVPGDVQAVANTLNTFWSYEATACNSGVAAPRTQLAGGSTWLYSDANTDGMLLRLNEPGPFGAYFAGWNAGPVAASSSVLAIHHPRGDVKKVSSGAQIASSAHLTTVGWTSGTTEGGSSGSGLFTSSGAGYELRGGLYGGEAACSNSGSLSNSLNRDYYSRLDVLFPNVRAYLSADAVPMNGSAPLLPPDTAAVSGAAEAVKSGGGNMPAARIEPGRDETRRRRLLQR